MKVLYSIRQKIKKELKQKATYIWRNHNVLIIVHLLIFDNRLWKLYQWCKLQTTREIRYVHMEKECSIYNLTLCLKFTWNNRFRGFVKGGLGTTALRRHHWQQRTRYRNWWSLLKWKSINHDYLSEVTEKESKFFLMRQILKHSTCTQQKWLLFHGTESSHFKALWVLCQQKVQHQIPNTQSPMKEQNSTGFQYVEWRSKASKMTEPITLIILWTPQKRIYHKMNPRMECFNCMTYLPD